MAVGNLYAMPRAVMATTALVLTIPVPAFSAVVVAIPVAMLPAIVAPAIVTASILVPVVTLSALVFVRISPGCGAEHQQSSR